MKNETKNAEKANIGEAQPKFQQAEPEEINEADLQVVSGGAHPALTQMDTSCN